MKMAKAQSTGPTDPVVERLSREALTRIPTARKWWGVINAIDRHAHALADLSAQHHLTRDFLADLSVRTDAVQREVGELRRQISELSQRVHALAVGELDPAFVPTTRDLQSRSLLRRTAPTAEAFAAQVKTLADGFLKPPRTEEETDG